MNKLSQMLYAIGERVHKLENKDMPTTVKINNGGTGATTAAAARKNLLENNPLSVAEGGTGLAKEYLIKNWAGAKVDKFYLQAAEDWQTIANDLQPILFTNHAGEFPTSYFKANSNGHITFKDISSFSKWYEWPNTVEKYVRIDVVLTPISISTQANPKTLNVVIRGNNNSVLLWKTFYGDSVRANNSFEASVTVPLENTFDIYVTCSATGGTVSFNGSDRVSRATTQLTLTALN